MGSSARLSWRYPFQTLLRANGCAYEMVGPDSFSANETFPESLRPGFDHEHEADGGRDSTNIGGQLDRSAPVLRPDIAMLYISVRDVVDGRSPSEVSANLSGIISKLRSANPRVTVLVAEIAPPDPQLVQATTSLNSAIRQLAAQQTTVNSPVVSVDMATGWQFGVHVTSDDYQHPIPAGESFLAQRWFSAYQSAGLCRSSPTVTGSIRGHRATFRQPVRTDRSPCRGRRRPTTSGRFVTSSRTIIRGCPRLR